MVDEPTGDTDGLMLEGEEALQRYLADPEAFLADGDEDAGEENEGDDADFAAGSATAEDDDDADAAGPDADAAATAAGSDDGELGGEPVDADAPDGGEDEEAVLAAGSAEAAGADADLTDLTDAGSVGDLARLDGAEKPQAPRHRRRRERRPGSEPVHARPARPVTRPEAPVHPRGGGVRIQKLLSTAGVASRRQAEEMIAQGRVTVNGKRAAVGQKVNPGDKVVVDGALVRTVQKLTLVLNKPRGYVSTRDDERGRATVLDLIKGGDRYLYPVGRLDYDSEGLMLLTNDGALANGLTHPRHQVGKTYRVLVERGLDDAQMELLRRGVMLEDGKTGPAEVEFHRKTREGFWYEIVIREGRNRQVRRMLRAVGRGVRRLVRVAIGPLKLADLPPGAYRPITPEELRLLKEAYGHRPVPAR